LNQDIRSAFAMTEPGVASSDATQICTKIERDGNDYVINGHKWYISGAIRPECKIFILLGKTRFDGPQHQQQSMILVPKDTPGINILRGMGVFGHIGDHAEIIFENVRVPATNMVLGEGRGFEIAQGRLGPGRIHHCMRTIGSAEQALEAIIYRVQNREAFGGELSKKATIRQTLAESRIDIEMTRQLCYLAAVMADEHGFKEARKYIAMIKVAAPRAALKIVDEAIQIHGAHGVSQDSQLSDMWTNLRTLRVADGPDIVHLNTIAKMELAKPPTVMGEKTSGINQNIAKYGKFAHVQKSKM
jgi:acyl-CoA dehydrogenase